MGPLEQQLGKVAAQRGWRLRWKSEPLSHAQNLQCTELDIFKGAKLLTADNPFFTIHSRDVDARERVALMVSEYQSTRGRVAA
jgi:hypothetical protein